MRGSAGLALLLLGLAACSGDDDDDDTGAGDGDADADGDTDADADGDLAECGNRVIDDGEECDGIVGCDEGSACTADCACEARPAPPPTSQGLIEQALADGTIDYPTSLMYRVWALFQAPELPEAYDGEGSFGEDTHLFLELSQVRGTLPDEIEAAIAPYLARPDDPSSIWSQWAVEMGGGADQPWTPRCAPGPQAAADWTSLGSTHFVVWSCTTSETGADLQRMREVTRDVYEEAYTAMVGTLPEPLADDFPNGPDPRNRIDIYVLETNQCRMRNGGCARVPNDALAAAVPATPCGPGAGGAIRSSGYLIVGAGEVPATRPARADLSEFRYTAAHELFHIISYGMNLGAQGGTCAAPAQPGLPPQEQRSWLTEATAEWAPFVFFPDDGVIRRPGFFSEFQRGRDDRVTGLQSTQDRRHPYQAFMYPLFVQEENGESSEVMFEVWIGSEAARTKEDLDDRLSSLFPFADHFRDFSFRNFNRQLPGDPIAVAHSGYDSALPFGGQEYESWVAQPPWTLPAPLTDLAMPLSIAPLAMQTEHVILRDEVRSFRVDGTGLGNAGHLSLDVIVKVNGEWSRRRLGAPVFEICRDDEVDDVEEAYLIWSNFDHDRAGRIDGDAKLTTRTTCPGGWSGTIRYTMSLEEHYVDAQPAGTTVYDASQSDVQTWTVVGTRMVLPPGAPEGFEIETVDASWHSTFSHSLTTSFTDEQCGTSTTTEGGTDGADGNTSFNVAPLGPGSWALQPNTLPGSYEVPITVGHEPCDAPASSSVERNHLVNESIMIILGIPELGALRESPNGSGHFQGTGTFIHDVQERPGGGSSVMDISAEWDLTRTPIE